MAEDVIDIRKRIEEIRNEVSTAMTDGGETVIQSRPAGEVAEFSVPGVTAANLQLPQQQTHLFRITIRPSCRRPSPASMTR